MPRVRGPPECRPAPGRPEAQARPEPKPRSDPKPKPKPKASPRPHLRRNRRPRRPRPFPPLRSLRPVAAPMPAANLPGLTVQCEARAAVYEGPKDFVGLGDPHGGRRRRESAAPAHAGDHPGPRGRHRRQGRHGVRPRPVRPAARRQPGGPGGAARRPGPLGSRAGAPARHAQHRLRRRKEPGAARVSGMRGSPCREERAGGRRDRGGQAGQGRGRSRRPAPKVAKESGSGSSGAKAPPGLSLPQGAIE